MKSTIGIAVKRPEATALAVCLMVALLWAGGCASSGQSQNKTFYTSGDREADQRAAQRMAQDAQLKGQGVGDGPANPDKKQSLYDRLGGEQKVEAIVDDFVTRAMADPRVNWDRKDVIQGGLGIHHSDSVQWDANPDNVKALKKHLAQFFALASGGPTVYEGREMKEAHAGLHITNDEFDASVGDLKATLDKLQVPNTEQKELLSIAETTRAQIVEER